LLTPFQEKQIRAAGTDVMILKNIFAKKFSEKLAFLAQNKAKLCKMLS
jgi:hypothetical protein